MQVYCTGFQTCFSYLLHTHPIKDLYAFCHEALADYVESFETYANFKELV